MSCQPTKPRSPPASRRAGPGGRSRGAASAGPRRPRACRRDLLPGRPGPDAMPPIDHPQFVPAAQARFLADDDVVFGLARAGQARAYPQLVLVWHEIVNDRFPDGPLSVTYCPLTGSVLAFRGTAPSGAPYTSGTSGRPGQLQPAHVRPPDRQLLAATARPSHPGAQPLAGPRAGAPGLDQVGGAGGRPTPTPWCCRPAPAPCATTAPTPTAPTTTAPRTSCSATTSPGSGATCTSRCCTKATASTKRRSWSAPSWAPGVWRSASRCCAGGWPSTPPWAAGRWCSCTTRRSTRDGRSWPARTERRFALPPPPRPAATPTTTPARPGTRSAGRCRADDEAPACGGC